MRITHLGHACVLIEAAETRILIDPGSFSSGWHDAQRLDGVLITHQHLDHVDPERASTLLLNNPHASVFTADDVHETVELPGARSVAPGDRMHIGGLEIEAVGGDHAIIHQEIPRIHNLGYVVRVPEAQDEPVFFHPGDSLEAVPEGVDVLALPIMGPWAAMKEHVEFVRALGVPAHSIPIHDELLSDRGREVLGRQIGNLTGTEIVWLRGGKSRDF